MKIAVFVDNYKVNAYKEAFDKANIVYTLMNSVTADTKQFIIRTENKDTVQKICTDLETYFKAKRN